MMREGDRPNPISRVNAGECGVFCLMSNRTRRIDTRMTYYYVVVWTPCITPLCVLCTRTASSYRGTSAAQSCYSTSTFLVYVKRRLMNADALSHLHLWWLPRGASLPPPLSLLPRSLPPFPSLTSSAGSFALRRN